MGFSLPESDDPLKRFMEYTSKTTYSLQFGEPPKAAEDFVVMKTKKFRSLEISKYFKP